MKLKFIFTLLISIQFCGFSYAAEEEAPSKEETSSDAELSSAIEDEGSNEESSEPGEDRFIPSTQISEDLSVSFPIDI